MLRPIPMKMSRRPCRFRRCPPATESQSRNCRRPIPIQSGIHQEYRHLRLPNQTSPIPTSSIQDWNRYRPEHNEEFRELMTRVGGARPRVVATLKRRLGRTEHGFPSGPRVLA